MTNDITPIETNHAGRRFRSRTEARWAVFFDALGWRYDYEREGYDLNGRWYLPDFYLPEQSLWVEVKGKAPTDEEKRLCHDLALLHGETVALVVGPPAVGEDQWHIWNAIGEDRGPLVFLEDRRNAGEYWLSEMSEDYTVASTPVGKHAGEPHDRAPLMMEGLRRAYGLASAERFDGK